MNPIKPGKIRLSPRQRTRLRLLVVTGISVLLITVVLVIYFQFFKNEVTKAKSVQTLTHDALPVDLVIGEQVLISQDTLSRNGVRYKIAKPLHSSSNTTR